VHELVELTSKISRGISPKYVQNDGVCVLNQKCIRNGTVNFELGRRHDEVSSKGVDAKKVRLFDVLVNSTGVGTLGRVALLKRLDEEIVTVDSHVTFVRGDDKKINKVYLGVLLVEKQNEIESFALGSTGQVELSRSQLEGIKIIVPPKVLQEEFEKICLPLFEKMNLNEVENQELREIRDMLLPMLMVGQITVQ